jgi:hypothetical protein
MRIIRATPSLLDSGASAPISRGTGSSNPSPSSGESDANPIPEPCATTTAKPAGGKHSPSNLGDQRQLAQRPVKSSEMYLPEECAHNHHSRTWKQPQHGRLGGRNLCRSHSTVRSGLAGGGNRIRTVGPTREKGKFPRFIFNSAPGRFRSGGRQRGTSRSSARSSRRWEGAGAERRGSARPALVGKPLHASDGPFGSSGLRLSVAGRFRAS